MRVVAGRKELTSLASPRGAAVPHAVDGCLVSTPPGKLLSSSPTPRLISQVLIARKSEINDDNLIHVPKCVTALTERPLGEWRAESGPIHLQAKSLGG